MTAQDTNRDIVASLKPSLGTPSGSKDCTGDSEVLIRHEKLRSELLATRQHRLPRSSQSLQTCPVVQNLAFLKNTMPTQNLHRTTRHQKRPVLHNWALLKSTMPTSESTPHHLKSKAPGFEQLGAFKKYHADIRIYTAPPEIKSARF